MIQEQDIPIQIHTLARYTRTHWEYTLTAQVSWDFRGVTGGIQLRVPLEHYNLSKVRRGQVDYE